MPVPSPKKEAEETTVIPDFEIETMARSLLPALQAFYASPEGKIAFEVWQQERDTH